MKKDYSKPTQGLSLNEKLQFYSRKCSDSDCVLWTGDTSKNGYGRLFWKRKSHRVHRLVWEIHNGPIPAGMLICHRCDVRFCINPTHLFLGTNADNTADMIRKGRLRVAKGEESGHAKLTEQAVRAIRFSRTPRSVLAEKFGVTVTTIGDILHRKSWRHLSEAP